MAKKNIAIQLPIVETPGNPPTTHIGLFAKPDKRIFKKDSDGNEFEVGAGGLVNLLYESVAANITKSVVLFEGEGNVNFVEVIIDYKHGDSIYRSEIVIGISTIYYIKKELEFLSDLGLHDYTKSFTYDDGLKKLTLNFNTSIGESGNGILLVQAQTILNP